MRTPLTTGRATAAALALAAGLLGASPAHADSISYIKDGDVWVTAPDGSRTVQITHDGGYSYASRADDGSFIALHGRRLHRLSPTGQLVADFDTPVSGEQTAPNTSYFRGPFKPEISPDGTKVAYEYWHQAYLTDPGCQPVGTPWCTGSRVSTGIGYTYSDRQTSWDEPGLGRQSGWVDPSWIDNSTLLQSYKSVRPNVDAIIDHPGDGNQTIQTWFEDTEAWYLKDGEISRRGDAAAFVSGKPRPASDPLVGQDDDQVTIYRMHGAAPALPEQCFSFHNPDVIYAAPTFAPDGAHVAFVARERGGSHTSTLFVAPMPNQAAGCALPTSGGTALMTGVSAPDWSPADVPTLPKGAGPAPAPGSGSASAPSGAVQPAAGGGAPGTGGTPQSGQAPGEATLQVGKGRVTRRAITGGRLSLGLTVPAAGRVRLTVVLGQRTLGAATIRVRTGGDARAQIKLGATARRALRRQQSITVRYRYTPEQGAPQSGRVVLRVR